MPKLKKLLPEPLRVAAFVSKDCTILRKMIEFGNPVVVIFSDSAESEATSIGKKFNIPVIVNDIEQFYAGRPLSDMKVRAEFDAETAKLLAPYKVTVAAFANYMHIATEPLLNAFLCINFHPGDLTVLNPDGSRKYIGKDAVKKAILAGEKFIRSSTIIAETGLDTGKILMLSKPFEVKNISAEENQKLMEKEDITLPKTLQYIAEGKFAKDSSGNLYFDSQPIPNGVSL